MRSILDPEAMRLAGIPRDGQLEGLERINAKMLATRNMKDRLTLDDRWHLELISNCPNKILVDLIKLFMRRFRRYGLAVYRETKVLKATNHEHVKIINSLRRDDIEDACRWLRRNLLTDKTPVLEWLAERNV